MVDLREKVKEIVESLPGAVAREVAGVHMSLELRDKKFGWYMENHHGNQRTEIECRALPGVAAEMVAKDPVHYYIPTYAGWKGWVGIYLDPPGVDWDEARVLLNEAYEMIVPKPKRKKREP